MRYLVLGTNGDFSEVEVKDPLDIMHTLGGFEIVRPRCFGEQKICFVCDGDFMERQKELKLNPIGTLIYNAIGTLDNIPESIRPILGDIAFCTEEMTAEGPELNSLSEKQIEYLHEEVFKIKEFIGNIQILYRILEGDVDNE